MAVALHAAMGEKRRLTQTLLAEMTGHCRQTVAKGTDRLEALGLRTADTTLVRGKLGGRMILVAAGLLLDTSISPAARLIRMQLQGAEARKGTVQLKWAALCEELRKGIKSVRKSLNQLVQASWLSVAQANRVAPLCLIQRNPIEEHHGNRKAVAMREILTAEFKGEAIMKEALSLLVDSRVFIDNAPLAFLVNPDTGEKLEFDR